MPVALVGTFVFFPLFGFSINTLFLFGLVLAIGLVVDDDAIVVVEAVDRHVEDGLSPKQAAFKAMEEIAGPFNVFGVFGMLWLRRAVLGHFLPAYMLQIENDVYSQIGLVMLLGLAAGAILIQHVVVIFQENVSFDHYLGTYPNAANLTVNRHLGRYRTPPAVNGLSDAVPDAQRERFQYANGTGATNPFRLDRSQAATTDQNHNYTPEQAAVHNGLMDLSHQPRNSRIDQQAELGQNIITTTGITMGYYDGNTVTALWNYAQRFAMSDNSYDTTFGPSTPGAINLIRANRRRHREYQRDRFGHHGWKWNDYRHRRCRRSAMSVPRRPVSCSA